MHHKPPFPAPSPLYVQQGGSTTVIFAFVWVSAAVCGLLSIIGVLIYCFRGGRMTAVYRRLENELLGVELGDRGTAGESASDLSNSARPEWMRGKSVLEAEAIPIADGNDNDAEEVMEVEATPIVEK